MFLSKRSYRALMIAVFLAAASAFDDRFASAQELSVGCADLNTDFWDGLYNTRFSNTDLSFYAGEIITVTAGPPIINDPSFFVLGINGEPFGNANYPGTIQHVVQADFVASFTVIHATGGDATFAVSCAAGGAACCNNCACSVTTQDGCGGQFFPGVTTCSAAQCAGTACGSASDTICDNPDTCSSTGTCQANFEPNGAPCNDGNACTFLDTCNGAGVCQGGGATICIPQDECHLAGTCDPATGLCSNPTKPNGTPCTPDTNPCTNDVCTAGVCSHPNSSPGTACGSPANTDCDNPDSCNGSGACLANNELNGTVCTPDTNQCTNDVCGSGVCTHPNSMAGTGCGSTANTDCDNPDTCTGSGACQANNEPNGTGCTPDTNQCTNDVCGSGVCTHPNSMAGTGCGSTANSDCDNPDTCNDSGSCQANNEPNGTGCTPDTNQCTDDVCAGGVCTHPNSPAETSCTPDTNECTSDLCSSGDCTHPCTDDVDPTPVGGCPPELLTLECGVDQDPGFNPTFEDNCDDELELFPISSIRLGDCLAEGFVQIIDRDVVARDDCGNEGSCSQVVKFVDTMEPVVTCTEEIVVRCTSPEGALLADVAFQVSATDICDNELRITDNRPDDFYRPSCPDDRPTVVTFRTTDDCGNEGTCQTRVYVYGPMCCPGFVDEELTLLPADVDLRQETNGPTITKGNFDIWNQDERRFSGTHRCVNCWDSELLSLYSAPNHFLRGMIHTDKGHARVDGLESNVCPGSVESPMVGVLLKEISFFGRLTDILRSAITPVGTGSESAQIRYDIIAPQNALSENAETPKRQNVEISEPIGNRQSAIGNSGTVAGVNPGGRGDITRKGSLLMWPRVEVRWNAAGELIEDTILDLSNDFSEAVDVQLYLVNGDGPLDAECTADCRLAYGAECINHPVCIAERAHPGWNKSDVQLTLTANQPTYWSAATGQPAGVSSFDILDPGVGPTGLPAPGRPDLDPRNPGGRVIRGFVLGWAVNPEGHEICWNHLVGDALLIWYHDSSAAEYNAWAFQCVADVEPGVEPDGSPGQLNLDGVEYEFVPDALIFDFYAVGSSALSHPDLQRRRPG